MLLSVSESVVLSELLDNYIHPSSSDPIVRHRLSLYVTSRSEVEVLMANNDQGSPHRSVASLIQV